MLRCMMCGHFQDGGYQKCQNCGTTPHDRKDLWMTLSDDIYWSIKAHARDWNCSIDDVIKAIQKIEV